jgi:dienelactone hydrolase
MRMQYVIAALCGAAFAVSSAQAAVKVQTVEYKQGDATLEGWLVYDTATHGKRPGVVVYPAFWGPSAHEKDVAQKLAKMGYVAFVADIYGKGVRPDTRQAAGAEAGKYMKDRSLLLTRAQAAYDQLKQSNMVDPNKIAAIGYCFGGAPALDMMRSGAALVDVVTFHGSLAAPANGADAKNIKTHVLVLHGAADPVVNAQVVTGFEKEMADDGIDSTVVLYGRHVVHAFTDNSHPADPSGASAYDALADKRSWQAMSDLFKNTL